MKSGLGWLLLAVPERTGEAVHGLLSTLNAWWIGIVALVGFMGLGSTATAWWYEQPGPEDLEQIEQKVETKIDSALVPRIDAVLYRQDNVIQDVRQLRRSVCRLQGEAARECERRVREDEERYEFELQFDMHGGPDPRAGARWGPDPDPLTRRDR